jgi:delta-aminolevulinic acid dehydratase/porphobilinogen synthase
MKQFVKKEQDAKNLEEGIISVSADIEQEVQDMDDQNMQSLNLFGMPDEQQRGRQGAVQSHNSEMKKIIAEMVLQARQDDPSANFMNYGQRKAYATYDPYNWES